MKRKDRYIRDESKLIAFGNRLRFLRKERGMTMQELADLTNIEYSQISRIERGLLNTSLSVVFELSVALDVSPEVLFQTTPLD